MSASPQLAPEREAVEATPTPSRGAGEWIDLAEAARRSGNVAGHVRRVALQLAARGLAEQRTPPEGGKPRWYLCADADPAFARAKAPAGLPFNLSGVSVRQRESILKRERLIHELDAALDRRAPGVSRRDATEEFCRLLADVDGERVSPRALEMWRADFRRDGRAGLVDDRLERGREEAASREDDPFLQEVKRLYLDQRGRSKQLCYDRAGDAAAEQGWAVCSYKTACRYLDKLNRRTVALHRGGDEAYAAAASYNQRDYSAIDSNDVWVGDHHRLDVICRLMPDGPDGKPRYGRPWLTAWLDMRSRFLVGWRIYAHDPNADVILRTFKDGCERHNAPWHVYIDNGKDYDSYALQGMTKRQRQRGKGVAPLVDGGVFGRLGVKVIHARPYRPQSKTIERFFGTVADRFARLFETYCGRSPEHKPEDLAAQIGRNKAPTVDETAASFGDWLDGDYHNRPHVGDAMDRDTPAVVFARELKRKRVLPADDLQELTLERSKPLAVRRNGVKFRGILFGKDHPALLKIEGQRVTLGVDGDDLSVVRVYAPDGRWLCTVGPNKKLPPLADKQQLRQASREQARDRKAAKAGHVAKMRLGRSLTDRLYVKAAAARERDRRQPQPTPPGQSLIPVRSPVEGQMRDLQRAMQQQTSARGVAAGAEAVRLDDLGRLLDTRDEQGEQQGAFTDDPFATLSHALRDGEQ